MAHRVHVSPPNMVDCLVRERYNIVTTREDLIMVKHLRKVGNSNAIILDKPLMELIGLEPGGAVNVQVNGTMICLSPVTPEGVDPETFSAILDEIVHDHGDVLRRLAK
jgi:antitoxin component of MazEF toxin-antitoxin module